jgi:lipopolysaccharide/colanic/teichoic acid biosynthesis glycosyltransferase
MNPVIHTRELRALQYRTGTLTTAGSAEFDAWLERSPIAGVSSTVKRLLDVGVALVALILLSPVIAVLALLIKIQDRGPAFYRRRVIGPYGEFDAFKLRTMNIDADQILESSPELRRRFEVNFKLKNDPRVTRVGAILRKSSLDELPQLWNVLAGEMSLVGPRMITRPELEKYGAAGRIFQVVKPGITGYWQIQGRQDVAYAERVEMDLFYVSHWSLWLDFKILVKTPIRVARGTGAS